MKEGVVQIAKTDAWESCLLASLFVHQNDFDIEKEVLEVAKNSLSSEKMYEKFQQELRAMQLISESNSAKNRGDLSSVNMIAKQIIEDNS